VKVICTLVLTDLLFPSLPSPFTRCVSPFFSLPFSLPCTLLVTSPHFQLSCFVLTPAAVVDFDERKRKRRHAAVVLPLSLLKSAQAPLFSFLRRRPLLDDRARESAAFQLFSRLFLHFLLINAPRCWPWQAFWLFRSVDHVDCTIRKDFSQLRRLLFDQKRAFLRACFAHVDEATALCREARGFQGRNTMY
jgi:hypothetical protein